MGTTLQGTCMAGHALRVRVGPGDQASWECAPVPDRERPGEVTRCPSCAVDGRRLLNLYLANEGLVAA